MRALPVAQQPVDVVDALAAEPARVRRAEALLGARGHVRGEQRRHRLAQDGLAVGRVALVQQPFAGSFSSTRGACSRSRSLSAARQRAARSRRRSLSRNGTRVSSECAMLELVLDDEQAVQERLQLEVERRVDVVLGRRRVPPCQPSKTARKTSNVERSPCRARHVGREERGLVLVGDEPLPEVVVAAGGSRPASALSAAVVAPRVAGEQLVAAGAGQHDLDELARQPRDVVVRVALADAQVLEVPDRAPAAPTPCRRRAARLRSARS